MAIIRKTIFVESDTAENVLKHEQGGSVMCNRTQGSEPAHPQSWHNCLPNEEQIGNPKNSSIQKFCMNEKIASKDYNSME